MKNESQQRYLRMSLEEIIKNPQRALARQTEAMSRGFVGIELVGQYGAVKPRWDVPESWLDSLKTIAHLTVGREEPADNFFLYVGDRLQIQDGRTVTVRGKLIEKKSAVHPKIHLYNYIAVHEVQARGTVYVCSTANA